MKVLLRRNVYNLGTIGDVVEVKPGYARNYLLPEGLAVKPTKGNVKAVEAEKQKYLEEVARQRAEMEVKASAMRGKEFTITARANPEGHLYGSVGPAQIVATMMEQSVNVEAQQVVIDSAIRQIGKYDVTIRFAHDITAVVHLTVQSTEGETEPKPAEAPAEAAEGEEAAPRTEPAE